MQILNGKLLADELRLGIQQEIRKLTGRPPGLAVILVGDDPASLAYVTSKQKRCQSLGMNSQLIRLRDSVSQHELIKEIDRLNADPTIDGLLVQLPLPPHINPLLVAEHIAPDKDVDGLHPTNLGKLLLGDPSGFSPCTPRGIQKLLTHYTIPIEGAHVVIIGRSPIVGRPLAAMLAQKGPHGNATVTLAHSYTRNLHQITRQADILVAAIGVPSFVTGEMVRKEAVVIDVGINRVEDASSKKGYRLVGDVDFASVKEKASAITPVPGGVGPLTIAMLLRNTLDSYYRRQEALCTNA